MNICVYGAASQQIHTDFLQGAQQLGHCLAKAGFGLVFGGGNTGVMGACARGAAQAGGEIQEGVLFPHCTRLHLTDTKRQRKEQMETLSQGFVMAPGGIGTLEEFFEILTLKQLGRHQKPIAVLNIRGYFDALEELLEGAVGEGFLEKEVLSMYRLFREPEEAVRFLVKELEVLP